MRKMYSEKQIKKMISESSSEVVEALEGQEIECESIEAKYVHEKMSGYSYSAGTKENLTMENTYVGVHKLGDEIEFVAYVKISRSDTIADNFFKVGEFTIPSSVGSKLFGQTIAGSSNILEYKTINAYKQSNGSAVSVVLFAQKISNTNITFFITGVNSIDANTDYVLRAETSFLLNESLAS